MKETGNVRPEVVTAVLLMMEVFWGVTPFIHSFISHPIDHIQMWN